MSIEVIGAGWGRTGTTSLRRALIKLGFDGCYHFSTLTPDDVPVWLDATDGKAVDWDSLFAGYKAAIDWPAAHFYDVLAARYPNAKVILTIRDPGEWFESATHTIYRLISRLMSSPLEENARERKGWTLEQSRAELLMARRIIIEQALGRPYEEQPYRDRELVIRRFNEHIQRVRDTIPSRRLLEFDVREGWEPLCEFLDVPVPEDEFPHRNARDQFSRGAKVMVDDPEREG